MITLKIATTVTIILNIDMCLKSATLKFIINGEGDEASDGHHDGALHEGLRKDAQLSDRQSG